MESENALVALSRREGRVAEAIFERLFPADENGPGAGEISVVRYVDRALSGAYRDDLEAYRLGLAAMDRAAEQRFRRPFADCAPEQQDELIEELETETLSQLKTPSPGDFFEMLRMHLQEGLFADPVYGGNRDKKGWAVIGHPGVWLENSAEENLSEELVTKGGVIRSLADLDLSREQLADEIPGFDPQRSTEPPSEPVDVVLVGVGGMGGIVAPVLCEAGLKVVGLEAGPWYTQRDFLPDELGTTYYCRAGLGKKFNDETPRWRLGKDDPTREATFSLGRMVNGVGGSIVHYGAWLRRYHPHHFEMRTYVQERWGEEVLPEGCTLTDWPISYDDLEPYYTLLEHQIGVAGDNTNPFSKRSKSLPMPPLRPFRQGELFRTATEDMGLHPHPVPAGQNSIPYDGRPATNYSAWSNGFGHSTEDKWHPGLSSVPEALATGNFELRTHCRVTRIITDRNGRASGVEYVDGNGNRHVQRASIVILCAYTFENVRLMLLSGDDHHPDGLGNNTGQVGKNFMTKMFAHVNGYFPDTIFNRHTGPAAQGVVLDDFLSTEFPSADYGFVGGATLGCENQLLPIQISRESLPNDVASWGRPYKDHLRGWQHIGTIRIQPDTLSYVRNYLDLDPHQRDRSGLGMPVIRITYDMQPNEHRCAAWMEEKSEEILRAMGASKVWRGKRFTGVGSSHDMGVCRMGADSGISVTDPELRVHDTPGLYVFSGATFPTCPGVNPTLTLAAVCYRAAERLVERLRDGEEP
jgi:gluconate 2-dehydrogenase alpha chain